MQDTEIVKSPQCNYCVGGGRPPPFSVTEFSPIYNPNDVWSIYILTQITQISENNWHTCVYNIYLYINIDTGYIYPDITSLGTRRSLKTIFFL